MDKKLIMKTVEEAKKYAKEISDSSKLSKGDMKNIACDIVYLLERVSIEVEEKKDEVRKI